MKTKFAPGDFVYFFPNLAISKEEKPVDTDRMLEFFILWKYDWNEYNVLLRLFKRIWHINC